LLRVDCVLCVRDVMRGYCGCLLLLCGCVRDGDVVHGVTSLFGGVAAFPGVVITSERR
jgi:hypothetical protein